jgi:Lrp/AsnC family leucine-responsive transcriptional regulator
MALQMETPLDATDWKILRELQQDARLSYHELGRRVALSAPAAAERVRKLEDRGVIRGYTAQIDPAKVGLPLYAFLKLRCDPEKCLLKTTTSDDYPEVLELHRLSGSHCSMLKVTVASMQHLQALTERLSAHGPVVTDIVLESVMTHRVVDWENPNVDLTPPPTDGWSKPVKTHQEDVWDDRR